MFRFLKLNFKTKLYQSVKRSLKYELPSSGKWHILNHFIMVVLRKKIYKYNLKLNENFLREILAFLITMYEFDYFSKIMIALGLSTNEKQQAECFNNYTKTYILRWIPGMLTSRYIMSRDFIRSKFSKNSVVRYNLKYMRTTVLKLYHLPDLLILNNMENIGSIVAKEAVSLKVPTIGLMTNKSYPHKIAFKIFGNVNSFEYMKSFLYILMFAMNLGKKLYLYNNTCGFFFKENFESAFLNKTKKHFLRKKSKIEDNFLKYKQYVIYSIFKKPSIILKRKSKIKYNFKKFYKFFNFQIKQKILKFNIKYLKFFQKIKEKVKIKEKRYKYKYFKNKKLMKQKKKNVKNIKVV